MKITMFNNWGSLFSKKCIKKHVIIVITCILMVKILGIDVWIKYNFFIPAMEKMRFFPANSYDCDVKISDRLSRDINFRKSKDQILIRYCNFTYPNIIISVMPQEIALYQSNETGMYAELCSSVENDTLFEILNQINVSNMDCIERVFFPGYKVPMISVESFRGNNSYGFSYFAFEYHDRRYNEISCLVNDILMIQDIKYRGSPYVYEKLSYKRINGDK